jgi:hypothetical protein
MKASIHGRVSHTNLLKGKALLPLFEAVVNSHQAIEEAGGGRHSIRILAERQGNLDDNKRADRGVYDHRYRNRIYHRKLRVLQYSRPSLQATLGGKGLGRFLWLRAFLRVEIDSHYREAHTDGLLHRRFNFIESDDEILAAPAASDHTAPLTTVRLVGYRQPHLDECPRSLDGIAQRLIGHFLPFFLNPHGPALILSDHFEEIDLREFYRNNFETFATRRDFSVAGQGFSLSGFRLQSAIADHHELIYGANYREVITERLSRFLPNLKNKLNDPERGQFVYLAFVQSPFFDAKVNSERTDFSIPREPPAERIQSTGEAPPAATDLFADDISLKTIREAAIAAITEDLKPFLDELNLAKEAALTSYIAEDAPQYRVLLKHKADILDQISPMASKNEIEMTLHRQLHKRQVELKQEGIRILAEAENVQDSQEYYIRFRKFVEDENELGKTALAQYIIRRRVILDLLAKALKQDPETGKYALEKTVHGLIFPMRSTSDDVPFEQQNLWIIDERLTFHSFLSSDQPLNTLGEIEGDSESRPDILIFNRPLAFSDEAEPLPIGSCDRVQKAGSNQLSRRGPDHTGLPYDSRHPGKQDEG